MREEGWYIDPFELHERRWFSDGVPTKLVSDNGITSNDHHRPTRRMSRRPSRWLMPEDWLTKVPHANIRA